MQATDPTSHRNWRWWMLLMGIGLLAFAFRYYYVVHAQVLQPVNQPNVRGDAVTYYVYARNLVEHGVFSLTPADSIPPPDSFRDPGYPVFLAGWMKLFPQWDRWYAAVLVTQAFLGTLTVLIMLCLGRRWMPLPWLAAAGVLVAVWPHSVAMCSYLLTETLFGFLVALGLLLLCIAQERRSIGWAVASGIGLALAALTNAVLLPLAVLLALYFFLRRQMNRAMCVALAVAALAVITPWLIRNSLLPRSEVSSSGRATSNLVQGSWPSFQSAYQAAMQHQPEGIIVTAAVDREVAVAESNLWAGLALMGRRMEHEPGRYIRWYLSKPALLWGWNIRIGQGDVYVYPTRNSPFKINTFYRIVEAICHALNTWLFALAFLGCALVVLTQKPVPPGIAATALTMLFVTAVYSLLQAEPRYSIPFRGAEIMLAVFSVRYVTTAVARLRTSAAIRVQ